MEKKKESKFCVVETENNQGEREKCVQFQRVGLKKKIRMAVPQQKNFIIDPRKSCPAKRLALGEMYYFETWNP
jgi:hypothetical protein